MDDRLAKILNELETELPEGENGPIERFTAQEKSRLEALLPRYTTAEPTAQQTAALIGKLLPRLAHGDAPIASRFADRLAPPGEHAALSGFVRTIMPQLRLLSIWFWLGSIAAIALSLLFMHPLARHGLLPDSNPVVLLAPLLSLVAVAYACRSYGTPLYELELSFPITPGQWLTGKIASVLIAYIMLFSGASVMMNWNDPSGLIPFTISWLVPLCLYSMMTLALMFRLGAIGASFLMLLLWLAQFALGDRLGRFYLLGDADYRYWAASKAIGALLALLAAAYVAYRIRRENAAVGREFGPAAHRA